MNLIANLAARFKEPSSFAGIATLLGLFGVTVAPAEWQLIVQVATGIAGLIAILVPEQK
jgi:hypothetical protein